LFFPQFILLAPQIRTDQPEEVDRSYILLIDYELILCFFRRVEVMMHRAHVDRVN